MRVQASIGTRTVTQYYDVHVPHPETGEVQIIRMEIKVDFESIAKQLGPDARKGKRQKATALHGAVVVQALKNQRP